MRSEQQSVAEEFDAYRDSYSQAVNEALSFTGMDVGRFVRAKARHLGEATLRHFGDTERELSVLDVGCGIGQYDSLIRPWFSRVVGVDVSTEAVDRARGENPGVEYFTYDGSRLPFDTDTFDVSFAICVLHHVPVTHWQHFVCEMHRVTRPGGLSFLFEHNPFHPLTRKVVSDCPFDRDAVLVKPRRARDLFQQADFDRVEMESILTIPAVDGWMKKVDRLFARTPLGTQYCLTATKRAA